jgi:hypothetical protein
MNGHFHTGPVDIVVTTLGVLVVIHVMRVVAAQLADSKSSTLVSGGKVLASFALSD